MRSRFSNSCCSNFLIDARQIRTVKDDGIPFRSNDLISAAADSRNWTSSSSSPSPSEAAFSQAGPRAVGARVSRVDTALIGGCNAVVTRNQFIFGHSNGWMKLFLVCCVTGRTRKSSHAQGCPTLYPQFDSSVGLGRNEFSFAKPISCQCQRLVYEKPSKLKGAAI